MHSNTYPKKVWLIIIIFVTIVPYKSMAQNVINSQIQELVYSIEGLTTLEQQQLTQDLSNRFAPIIQQEQLDSKLLKDVEAIISAGIFEGASFDVIADVSVQSYLAERNGAPGIYIRDLALIGFATYITSSQLEMSARGIDQLLNAHIDPFITEDFIAYALYNGWSGEIIRQAVQGLITGANQGLDPQRLALSLIISIDKESSQKSASLIVQEAIEFLKALDQKQPQESQRQKLAHRSYQESIQKGLSRSVAEEIYFTAIEDNWSTTAIQAVYNGLLEGLQKGLTPERLATAILIRFAQIDQTLSPEKIVDQEMEYVAGIEKKRVQLIKQDEKKFRRVQPPKDRFQQPYLQPSSIPAEPSPDYFNATARSSINQRLMWQSIQEFLGPPPTPYRWGGTSKFGVDCSGFVKKVYEQQGIYLPRNSAQQYQVGIPITGNLQFGDLVFFSKYGPLYSVTHVGIYIGGDKFVHSSASKGVSISSLNKRYYRLRLKGAKRVI